MTEPKGKPAARRPLSEYITIGPSSDPATVTYDGKVAVSGTFTNTTLNNVPCDGLYVKVYAPSDLVPDTPPWSDDNSVVFISRAAGATTFASSLVPAAAAWLQIPTTGAANNVVVGWPRFGLDQSGNPVFGDTATQQFTASLTNAPVKVTVSAQCCIWFTWTMDAVLNTPGGGTGFGEVGTPYRPVPLIRPTDATSLTLTTVKTDTWAHLQPASPSDPDISGPEGIARTVALEYPLKYQNAQLLSTNIAEPNDPNDPNVLRLNRLIGLWGTNANTPATVVDIGTGQVFNLNDPKIPALANRLFLAFHDGHEWTNNWQQVNVTATWSKS